MSTKIKTLLKELYELEPKLEEKETELVTLIESMLTAKPNVEIDDSFRRELKKKVMHDIVQKNTSWWTVWTGTLAGAVVACLVFGVWIWPSKEAATVPGVQLSFAQNVRPVAANGFGNITLREESQLPRQQSGGGGSGREIAMANVASVASPIAPTPVAENTAPASDTVATKMAAPDTMIYPPMDFPTYTYSYDGELTLPTGTLPVYKKTTIPFSASETQGIVRSLSLADINMGAFSQLGISNLTLAEDKQYGYIISLDFLNGAISMYQNYLNWPQPTCDQNGCSSGKKLTESDIPSNDRVIAAGQSFIQKYGINASIYGTPKVDNSWKIMYARSSVTPGQESMVPEMYTLTYPLRLDDKLVYEEGGMYRGLTLTYDIRTDRITNMYGIEKSELEKSEYNTITELTTIQKMIKNGGRYVYTDTVPQKDQKVIDIKLGEPTIQYVHLYGEWKNGKSDEYYVPAYVFPVTNKPEDSYISDTVIIPLISDFVIEQTNMSVPTPLSYSTKGGAATDPAVEPIIID